MIWKNEASPGKGWQGMLNEIEVAVECKDGVAVTLEVATSSCDTHVVGNCLTGEAKSADQILSQKDSQPGGPE